MEILETTDSNWVYIRSKSNRWRFVLGKPGVNNIACFGINPSTACPEKLDNTIKSVQRIAGNNGYDGWFMFNLSPQRATDPKDLYKRPPKNMFKKNRELIIEHYDNYKIKNTWIAWGNLLESRNYFKMELIAIYNTLMLSEMNWKTISQLNKSGHPKHPLYQPANTYLTDFEIQKYINKL